MTLSATVPMAHRSFKIATVVSTVMLAMSVVLFIAGYVLSPRDCHLSLHDDFHVGAWASGLDSRLVFFNDGEHGPYRGSIIGLANAEGRIDPPLVRKESFGDSWGIYYRHFQWSDSRLWTLMVTLWYPIALFAILPLISVVCFSVRRLAANA